MPESHAKGGDNMATKTKDKAEVKEAAVIRPEDLAKELGVSGKQVRAYLRSEFTRPTEQKRSSWVLTPAQAEAVRVRFTPSTEEEDGE
jgi:hypothetical protein